MAANGRVLTGFSLPYVALYASSGTTVTYSSGSILARGVSVSVENEQDEDANVFYADNVAAETVEGEFKGGTFTLTVDGLLSSAEALIYGLSAADGDGWVSYGTQNNAPYVGVGFVCRYMSDGVESYVPVILTKCKFNLANLSAATQEEDIDWQTQELTGRILIDANNIYKKVGTAVTTEALASSAIKTVFNVA